MNSFVPELNASASDDVEDERDGFNKYDLGFLSFAFTVLASCYAIAFLAMIQVNRSTRQTEEERVKAKPASEVLIESQLIVREWNDGAVSSAEDGVSLNHYSATEQQVQVETPTRSVCEKRSNATGSSSSSQQTDLAEETDNCSLSENEETAAECAICLASYECGDQVCESNNMSCKHTFHKDCMLSWLTRHNECPVCRQIYLLETA